MKTDAASSPAVQPACFGKLPSRADFVRCGAASLTGWLDRWVAGALESALEDPGWKASYDRAPAVRFAVLDAASPMAVCGHIRPSADAAGRRFPFVVALAAETSAPRERLRRAPLVFSRGWQRCAAASRVMATGAQAPCTVVDRELGGIRLPAPADYGAICADHESLETIAGLSRGLRPAHPAADLRHALLGLGDCVARLASSGARPAPGIALPLPPEPLHAALTAAWWAALLADAVDEAGRELLLIRPDDGTGPPRLLASFDGASPAALAAIWNPARARAAFLDLASPASAPSGPRAARDAAAGRLASYLEHGDVSLALVGTSWREAFGSGR